MMGSISAVQCDQALNGIPPREKWKVLLLWREKEIVGSKAGAEAVVEARAPTEGVRETRERLDEAQ
jgi:hypothetical protein